MATAHTNHLEGAGPSRDLIVEFILQADVTEATRAKYRTHLAAFSVWLHANGASANVAALLHATPGDVHRFLASLRAADRVGGPLSPSTRKNYLASLRSFYAYGRAVRLVDADPSASVRAPRIARTPGMHLSADELRRLLHINTTPRDRIQTYLLVYTGARSGELRSLRWREVDFNTRTMTLRGKGGKTRVIDIHPVLAGELRRWFVHMEIAAETSRAIAAARQDPETDFVLLTRNGQPVRASTLYRQLKRRACLAGLYPLERKGREPRSAVSPHALRRSFATILLNDGHPIDVVADVLGHSSLDTTRLHYAFSSSARRRETMEAFAI